VVRADVLRDAAGLAGDHVRLADVVEQRRLAVVDVAHDGDHGRARHERLLVDRVGLVLAEVGAVLLLATAWKPNSAAMTSIWSKSRRWLMVTMKPSSLSAKPTIWVGETLRICARSATVMNSFTRTVVRSRCSRRALRRELLAVVLAAAARRRASGCRACRAACGCRLSGDRALVDALALLPRGDAGAGAPRAGERTAERRGDAAAGARRGRAAGPPGRGARRPAARAARAPAPAPCAARPA
jgi:hypothetical protein